MIQNLRFICALMLALLAAPACALAAEAEKPKQDAPKQPDAAKDGKAKEDQSKDPPTKEEDIPPALTHYLGREIAQTMHYAGAPWLTRESREREEDSKTMFKMLDLKEGQIVCDMGSGNGFYTLPMAKAVGDKGKVYAVEIQPQMLAFLKKRAKAANVENIEYVLGTVADPKLKENSQDIILLVDVYHEIDHPVQMLDKMRKALKPDGKMVLVEFRTEDPKVPIKPEHKMSKKQIMKEIPVNGFKLVKEFDKLPWQHMMWFQRDPDWKGPAPDGQEENKKDSKKE